MDASDVMSFLREYSGSDATPYYCVKCRALLEKIIIKTTMEQVKKLFYCKNNHCRHFGIITVVAHKQP